MLNRPASIATARRVSIRARRTAAVGAPPCRRVYPGEDAGAPRSHVTANGGGRRAARMARRAAARCRRPRGASRDTGARDRAIEDELRGARGSRARPHGGSHLSSWRRHAARAALALRIPDGVASRFRGRFAVAAGGNPYALKRLEPIHLRAAGRGRRRLPVPHVAEHQARAGRARVDLLPSGARRCRGRGAAARGLSRPPRPRRRGDHDAHRRLAGSPRHDRRCARRSPRPTAGASVRAQVADHSPDGR